MVEGSLELGNPHDRNTWIEQVAAIAAQEHVTQAELSQCSERNVDAARAGFREHTFARPARFEELLDPEHVAGLSLALFEEPHEDESWRATLREREDDARRHSNVTC